MMSYPFKDEAGERVNLYLEPDWAVQHAPLGDWIVIEGRKLMRVFADSQTTVLSGTATKPMEVHCMQMPKWDPRAPRHDKQGRTVLLSKREHDEYKARTGAVEGQGVD